MTTVVEQRRAPGGRVLAPETVARLGRLRLALRRRVDGRYVGAHPARGHGSSQDFVDYREYTPGDDPRLLDPYAYARLGRRVVKLFAAEDTAALRVVVDRSASMGFGAKAWAAAGVAAALVAIAAAGGDRARILFAGGPVDPGDGAGGSGVDPGPWLAGPAALPAAEARLAAGLLAPAMCRGRADLAAALRRAAAEGPRGPVVLVSDLLTEDWPEVVRLLGAARADAVLVHLLGREDLEPTVRGDVRLADAETGAEVDLAVADGALERYAAARDAWLDAVARTCGAHGVTAARLLDDEPVEPLFVVTLRRLGFVA